MFFQPRTRILAEKPEGGRPALFIPTVYEQVEEKPNVWEYYVLSVDPREDPLPDAERLSSLGQQSWIMVGILDERATGKGEKVHYYFARQKVS